MKYSVCWEGFRHRVLAVIGKIFSSQKILAGASVHWDNSLWEGSFQGKDNAHLVGTERVSQFPQDGPDLMHFPALLTAPKLFSQPVYYLRISPRHTGKTLSVFTEIIFKDTTVTCSSAQRIFPACHSLSPCSARGFRWGFPIMSKGAKQKTRSAWCSIHWASQAPSKGERGSDSWHVQNPIRVSLCTTHGKWEARL